jgi:hypothetical protein
MLDPICEDLYGVSGTLRMPTGVVLPLRCTIIRLPGGDLVVHSPIRFSDADAAAINALGPVRHLVAPNGFHHLYVKHALDRWPTAVLTKSPALVKKRADLAAAHILGEGQAPWDTTVLEPMPIDGAPMAGEFCFFHRPSGALLLTDAAFNVTEPANLVSALMFRLGGTYKTFRQSRLFGFAIKDRAAAARSARTVLERPIRLVIPCHGEVVAPPTDAHAALTAAWAPMLR